MNRRQALNQRIGLALLLLALPAQASKGPRYTYGQAWWQEYSSDDKTVLLLHFGPPMVTAGERVAKELDARKKQDELLTLESIKDSGEDGVALLTPNGMQQPPVNETSIPAGSVADYSDRRLVVALGAGMTLTPAGRFGAGLECTGQGAMAATVPNPQAGECSFRVSAFPAQTACLMSFDNDEARLLLRPDGRLELKLRKPHGIMNETKLAPAVIQAFRAKDASIVSPDPVPLNEWVHVAIWSKPHPAPGNTSPFDARLTVNGTDVAWYLSEGGNRYQNFLGSGQSRFVLGNNAAGTEGFAGLIDEVRVSSVARDYYERPPMPWRDATLARPLQFDIPFFRSDGTVFHASLDKGLGYDRGGTGTQDVRLDLRGQDVSGLAVDGIRGKGWLVDPAIGFPRFPLAGMTSEQGALEFWMRPVNWDDLTGYWHHGPPEQKNLSVARLVGEDGKRVFNVTIPRAYNLERARLPVDPGRWLHIVLTWNKDGWGMFVDGRVIGGARREQAAAAGLPLAYAEFGVADQVTVLRGEPPRIEIDEVVGYRAHLAADEVAQARRRWMGALDPIRTGDAKLSFKYSLQKLEFSLVTLLPATVNPKTGRVSLCESNGPVVLGPFEGSIVSGRYDVVMSEGQVLPYKAYQAKYQVLDDAGQTVIDGVRDWDYREEPWRNSRAGILDKTPAPWTPIRVEGRTLATRMTTYTLGDNGLPVQIKADGEDLLAAPFQLLEDGQPMAGTSAGPGASKDVAADWEATFTGKTCDVDVTCHAEYDGMIRYELAIRPRGKVAPLRFVMPVKAARATRYLYYPMGARGVSTGTVPPGDGKCLESRVVSLIPKAWQDYRKARTTQPALQWEAFWEPLRAKHKGYGFFGHVDLNDRNRGLFWFCDNAAGWWQSPQVSAVEIDRQGDTVSLVLNLVAEPVDYVTGKPIVFAVLPHPARPLPDAYRLYNRVSAEKDARHCDIYDAFYPWPMDPRDHAMKLYPAADPKAKDQGPSWAYAESCIPVMRACKPKGLVTMYLSRAWFGCRAGAYDHWEWRSGESGAASLTPWFNNYLCWEMDEWIRRGVWDAIYLDECYETPARNLEAGFSVKLPDGSEQPGVQNFMFRDLMKRWRNIFTAHGKEPLQIAHHTYSWQYPGLVYCDSTLDGENAPIVSLNSADWIDSTSKERYEALQNARLWGVSTFYMPFIAEGGFDNKEKSQFPVWQWRMARQAQSMFAHYETATVYEGQGSQVYKGYWTDLLNWGAGDPTAVTFIPYWNAAPVLTVPGQGGDVLVSCYRGKGKALVIASNRAKTNTVLRITLDRSALGLGGSANVRSLDATFDPPPGEDFRGAKAGARETATLLEKSLNEFAGTPETMTDDDLDTLLDGADAVKARERASFEPALDGAVLVVPVRARDYRVVAVE